MRPKIEEDLRDILEVGQEAWFVDPRYGHPRTCWVSGVYAKMLFISFCRSNCLIRDRKVLGAALSRFFTDEVDAWDFLRGKLVEEALDTTAKLDKIKGEIRKIDETIDRLNGIYEEDASYTVGEGYVIKEHHRRS
jgi:hypothetical protein